MPAGLNDPLIQISSFDRPNIRYMLMEKFKPLDQLMRYVQEQRGKVRHYLLQQPGESRRHRCAPAKQGY